MHQPICQFAIGRKNKQPGSIDIEATDGDPLAVFHTRQIIKYRDAVTRVAGRDNLALGFVIQQDARKFFVKSELDRTLVDHHVVTRRDLRASRGDDAVDHHATGRNHDLHIAPRAVARLR